MQRAAERMRAAGGHPVEVPLGASTPIGAIGFVRAVGEMLQQGVRPDVIVHATSSGGTQAGLVAGCALHGLSTRVIGVSADDPAADVERQVRSIIAGMSEPLGSVLRDVARDAVDRGRRHVRRRRLRRADSGVDRSAAARGANGGAVRRSHLHREGARGTHRARARTAESRAMRRCCSGTRAVRSGCSPNRANVIPTMTRVDSG